MAQRALQAGEEASAKAPLLEANFRISGHQIDLGESLRAAALESLQRLATKYFDGAEEVSATFSRARHGFGCSVRLHAGHGRHFEGHGEHESPYGALGAAVEHAAKQARRLKRAQREDKDRAGLRSAAIKALGAA